MVSPVVAVLLVAYVNLLTIIGARAFVVPCPQTMAKRTGSVHGDTTAAAVGHRAHDGESAAGSDVAVHARLEVEGLSEVASQYDAFLIGEMEEPAEFS